MCLQYDDEFRLVVATSDDIDYTAIMLGPFKPFTLRAWLITAVLVLYMSTSMRICEGDPAADSDEISLTQHLSRMLGVPIEEHIVLRAMDKVLGIIAKVTFNATFALTQGIPTTEAITFPGRVIALGYATFGLMFLTTYTGKEPTMHTVMRLDHFCHVWSE